MIAKITITLYDDNGNRISEKSKIDTDYHSEKQYGYYAFIQSIPFGDQLFKNSQYIYKHLGNGLATLGIKLTEKHRIDEGQDAIHDYS